LRGALTAKNTLVEVDTTRVEKAFELKGATLVGVEMGSRKRSTRN
jgi:hypothetical protein